MKIFKMYTRRILITKNLIKSLEPKNSLSLMKTLLFKTKTKIYKIVFINPYYLKNTKIQLNSLLKQNIFNKEKSKNRKVFS
jgi:hypothetical protein